jgi:hypothetical protein
MKRGLVILLLVMMVGCEKTSPIGSEGDANLPAPEAGVNQMQTAEPESGDKQVIEMTVWEDKDIIKYTSYGNSQWLHPYDESQEKLSAEPAYKSEKPVYYGGRYGNAADNIHTMVIDESGGTGSGYDTLYVDANNDNRLDEKNEKYALELSGTTITEQKPTRVKIQITVDQKQFGYYFDFVAFNYTDENHPVEKIHVNARNSSGVRGEAIIDGEKYTIAVGDLDSNGLFNDIEQGLFRGDRFFIDLNGDGDFRDPEGKPEESIPYAQFTPIKGKWYSITLSADGRKAEISQIEPIMGTIKASAEVSSITLRNRRQTQKLAFTAGVTQALAGSYRLYELNLQARDDSGNPWRSLGKFSSDNAPEIIITENCQVSLSYLLPLTVEIQAEEDVDPDAITFKLVITGGGGGTFQSPVYVQPQSGFEIRDEKGAVIFASDFEYG